MGKSGSRSKLESFSLSGMNGHAAGNASRQYSTPRNLELILNPLLRVPEYELRTGTKLRQQSTLDKTPEVQGLDPQTNGVLPLKHATTRER